MSRMYLYMPLCKKRSTCFLRLINCYSPLILVCIALRFVCVWDSSVVGSGRLLWRWEVSLLVVCWRLTFLSGCDNVCLRCHSQCCYRHIVIGIYLHPPAEVRLHWIDSALLLDLTLTLQIVCFFLSCPLYVWSCTGSIATMMMVVVNARNRCMNSQRPLPIVCAVVVVVGFTFLGSSFSDII